ncbi:hypothetical protein [Ruminococcus sp.]|uniref:hypothetical protein n=1 Tax=Ruminococcus sp. TaxID=41978 RepID=UPI003890F4F1
MANEPVVSTSQYALQPQHAPQTDYGRQQPDYRQQHLSETQQQPYPQQPQRDFPGGGGMPSDGGYYSPDDDLPF